jgi:hypothetical protein
MIWAWYGPFLGNVSFWVPLTIANIGSYGTSILCLSKRYINCCNNLEDFHLFCIKTTGRYLPMSSGKFIEILIFFYLGPEIFDELPKIIIDPFSMNGNRPIFYLQVVGVRSGGEVARCKQVYCDPSYARLASPKEAQTQGRQSAKLFLQSSEFELHHPLTRRRVCPPPPFGGGGGGTLACGRGGGRGPIPTRGTYTVVLYIYMYFLSSNIVQ